MTGWEKVIQRYNIYPLHSSFRQAVHAVHRNFLG